MRQALAWLHSASREFSTPSGRQELDTAYHSELLNLAFSLACTVRNIPDTCQLLSIEGDTKRPHTPTPGGTAVCSLVVSSRRVKETSYGARETSAYTIERTSKNLWLLPSYRGHSYFRLWWQGHFNTCTVSVASARYVGSGGNAVLGGSQSERTRPVLRKCAGYVERSGRSRGRHDRQWRDLHRTSNPGTLPCDRHCGCGRQQGCHCKRA